MSKVKYLQRSSSLQSLDVSHNEIPNLSFGLTSAWPQLADLCHLDVSSNPITYIIKGDFKYLDNLETLKMNNLKRCTKVERGAFVNIKALRELEMVGLPKVRIYVSCLFTFINCLFTS